MFSKEGTLGLCVESEDPLADSDADGAITELVVDVGVCEAVWGNEIQSLLDGVLGIGSRCSNHFQVTM